jgi:hypothetical protein
VPSGSTTSRFIGPIQPLLTYLYFNGSTTHPGLVSGDAVVFGHATSGAIVSGYGSSYDVSLQNRSGATALRVPTGTTNVETVGSLTSISSTGGIGYATGAGGPVTQLTSKSTGVTLGKVAGQITMNGAALAAAHR